MYYVYLFFNLLSFRHTTILRTRQPFMRHPLIHLPRLALPLQITNLVWGRKTLEVLDWLKLPLPSGLILQACDFLTNSSHWVVSDGNLSV